MFSDTIIAIATPVGFGGIGIIRISGPDSYTLLKKYTTSQKYTPWKLQHTYIIDAMENIVDDILAVYMPAPNTFTGEDVVELHCHGSPVVLYTVLQIFLNAGVRNAERGEFSKRAFLNNRMTLEQAEAIMEIIHAPDTVALGFAQKRLQGALGKYIAHVENNLMRARMELYIALDFPEEDLDSIDIKTVLLALKEAKQYINQLMQQYQQNHIWQSGATVLLAGNVNAGKSSLFNAMLGMNRAIVSPVEGTTRDYVTERISLKGIPITLIDTAGLRNTSDAIEQQGIDSMMEYAKRADCIIFVIDATKSSVTQEESNFILEHTFRCIIAYNKIDSASIPNISSSLLSIPSIECSATTMKGIDSLLDAIYTTLVGSVTTHPDHNAIVPNARQYQSLLKAYKDIELLISDIEEQKPLDAISAMLEYTLKDLQEITGYTLPDDVLNSIFESFCIGK